jgi:hypothetical protein
LNEFLAEIFFLMKNKLSHDICIAFVINGLSIGLIGTLAEPRRLIGSLAGAVISTLAGSAVALLSKERKLGWALASWGAISSAFFTGYAIG